MHVLRSRNLVTNCALNILNMRMVCGVTRIILATSAFVQVPFLTFFYDLAYEEM